MDAGAEALAFISMSVHAMSGQIMSDKVYNQYQHVFIIFTDATAVVFVIAFSQQHLYFIIFIAGHNYRLLDMNGEHYPIQYQPYCFLNDLVSTQFPERKKRNECKCGVII